MLANLRSRVLADLRQPLEVLRLVGVLLDDHRAFVFGEILATAVWTVGLRDGVGPRGGLAVRPRGSPGPGLFWSSCSMRSSSAISGSWRISIDWIIRGVSS
jgi:hypothetical protein